MDGKTFRKTVHFAMDLSAILFVVLVISSIAWGGNQEHGGGLNLPLWVSVPTMLAGIVLVGFGCAYGVLTKNLRVYNRPVGRSYGFDLAGLSALFVFFASYAMYIYVLGAMGEMLTFKDYALPLAFLCMSVCVGILWGSARVKEISICEGWERTFRMQMADEAIKALSTLGSDEVAKAEVLRGVSQKTPHQVKELVTGLKTAASQVKK